MLFRFRGAVALGLGLLALTSASSAQAATEKIERARALIAEMQRGDAREVYKSFDPAERKLARWALMPGPVTVGYDACGDDSRDPRTWAECYEPLPNSSADAGPPSDLSMRKDGAAGLMRGGCKNPSKEPTIWMSSVAGIRLISLRMSWSWCWSNNRITSWSLTPVAGTPAPFWEFKGWATDPVSTKGPEMAFVKKFAAAKFAACFIHCARFKTLWLDVTVKTRGGWFWKGDGA